MPMDRNLFVKQMIKKYNDMKQELIVILNTPDKEKKPEDLNSEGMPLKDVLQKMRISESELRNALTNVHGDPAIEIFAKEEKGKEEQWIKIVKKR